MRKLFRVKTEFPFSDIICIGHKGGPYIDRLGRGIKRKPMVFFETTYDWEVFACQFMEAEEAEQFVITLRKFLSPKEKIIA